MMGRLAATFILPAIMWFAMASSVASQDAEPIPIWTKENFEARVPAPLFPQAVKVRLFATPYFYRVTPDGQFQTSRDGDEYGSDAYPGSGVALAPREIAELRASVWYTTEPNVLIGCCWPRHVFLFYGRNDKYLGFLAVCYECGCAVISPSEAPSEEKQYIMWDSWKIAQIIKAHRLPTDFHPDRPSAH